MKGARASAFICEPSRTTLIVFFISHEKWASRKNNRLRAIYLKAHVTFVLRDRIWNSIFGYLGTH